MASGRAVAWGACGGRGASDSLHDSGGTRLCRGGGVGGKRLHGLRGARWLGAVPEVPASVSSDLFGSFAAALPGVGGAGGRRRGGFSARREASVAAGAETAGPSQSRCSRRGRTGDSHRAGGVDVGPI